jgi:NAD(P)-dependent dehydrogenase (short-subunit alcohol dehydrogenase family)
MKKTILVVGFGPGISSAVADRFGAAGFSVGLVARNEERLAAGVKMLAAKGVTAAALRADASDPESIRGAVKKARESLGPIAALHWNAYGGEQAGDLVVADPAAVRSVFDVAIVGLLEAVKEALPDLKETKGAVLITNGAFGDIHPGTDELAVNFKAMGLALANAAKHKLVGLLAKRLEGDGVYVGEVMVAGMVKGTLWDASGAATLEASTIAEKFWELYQARSDIRGRVS